MHPAYLLSQISHPLIKHRHTIMSSYFCRPPSFYPPACHESPFIPQSMKKDFNQHHRQRRGINISNHYHQQKHFARVSNTKHLLIQYSVSWDHSFPNFILFGCLLLTVSVSSSHYSRFICKPYLKKKIFQQCTEGTTRWMKPNKIERLRGWTRALSQYL